MGTLAKRERLMPVAFATEELLKRRLLHHHYQRLKEDYGLTNFTIALLQLRSDTEDEQQRLMELVNSRVPPGPAIVVPYFDQHGTRLDYHVIKHDHPSL